MRRQSKPFVTEYRASGRRPRDAASPLRDADGVSAPAAGRVSEDDYEAVFRAADALFAAPGGLAEAPASRAPSAGPAAADVFAATTPAETEPAANPSGAPSSNISPPSGGRILRAIEEPAADPFAAYEAALAPKRRGRKPGSKNKPKPTAPLLKASLDAPAAFESSLAIEDGGPTPVPPMPTAFPRGDAPSPRTRESFAWVRTKLRPGQKWKRRLPKVAW